MEKTSYSVTKSFALLFFLVGMSQSFAAWDGTAKAKPSKETIGNAEYFLIETEANLAWFRDSVNTNYGTIKINAMLMSNLDMGHKLFVPIAAGSDSTRFGGIFDGNGFTISNLYFNSEELGEIPNEFCPSKKPKCNAQNVGFIGALGGGGVVKNLNLENVDILASTNRGESGAESNPVSVGPVVAFQKENATVEGCFVTGNILTSGMGNGIGGLVGNAWSGKITNSLSTVSVRVSGDDSYVGGIVGLVRKSGTVTVEACAYDGNIIINSGNGTAGGIVGSLEQGNLSVSRTYYGTRINVEDGVGKQADDANYDGTITGKRNLNADAVVCDLNGGQWVEADASCSKDGLWSVGVSHIALHGVSVDANGDVVYEILFDANEGVFASGAKNTKFLKAGDLITADEISTPVHGDTVFGGWALTADAAEPTENFGTVSGSKTIFAYWKTMYEITFDATDNGAFVYDEQTKSTIKKKLVAAGETIDVDGIGIPEYDDDGGPAYFFAGWRESVGDEQPLSNLGTASGPATFYALWVEAPTYVVTFNTRGFGTTVAYVQENAQNDQTVASPENPVAEGREFVGWFESEDADESFDFTTPIRGNLELYAKWTPVDYDITYELDGGNNNSGNPDSYNIESADIKLKIPTKKGFSFDGWYYDASFTNTATQISKGSSGAKKFYAKWTPQLFTITYMAGSYGAEVVPAEYKAYGDTITLRGAVYTRAGYIQKGWAKTNGGKKYFELDAKYGANASLELYPYWEADPTSIRYGETKRLSSFSVAVQGRTLDIYGAVKEDSKWAVYDMQGGLIAQGVVRNAPSRVQIQKSGNYVVRMGGQFRMVRVR